MKKTIKKSQLHSLIKEVISELSSEEREILKEKMLNEAIADFTGLKNGTMQAYNSISRIKADGGSVGSREEFREMYSAFKQYYALYKANIGKLGG